MAESDTGDRATQRTANGGSRPVPDPTELTDRAIAKLKEQVEQYIDGQLAIRDERLRGIDTATELRLQQGTALHKSLENSVVQAVEARAAVVDEKFKSIETRFAERDTRSENEKRDSKVAVDAAFAAQKEAAAAQEKSNREAIDKSEKATAETIKTNQELNAAKTDSLTKTLDEVKYAVNTISSVKVGGTENRTTTFAVIGMVVTIVLAAITIIGFVISNTPK